MTTLAAGTLSGQILGSLGASGVALAATVILVLGIKGKHKIKFDQHKAAIVGYIAGTLYYVAAVGIWSAPGSLTQGIAQAVQGGVGGSVGLGAVAICITAIIYGAKLRPSVSACFGIAAASTYIAAGGVWALVSTILSSGLKQMLGA
jgi:hypothetical protein